MHSDDPSHPDDGSDEKVLILPLGEESKKITQTLSNDSARQVLELLTDKPMSASEIARELGCPTPNGQVQSECADRIRAYHNQADEMER